MLRIASAAFSMPAAPPVVRGLGIMGEGFIDSDVFFRPNIYKLRTCTVDFASNKAMLMC